MNTFRDAYRLIFIISLCIISLLNVAEGHLGFHNPKHENIQVGAITGGYDFGTVIAGTSHVKSIPLTRGSDDFPSEPVLIGNITLTDNTNFQVSLTGSATINDLNPTSDITVTYTPTIPTTIPLGTPTHTTEVTIEFKHDSHSEDREITLNLLKGEAVPRDVVLLLDTSGSMGWHRTGSAKDLGGGCCSRLSSAKFAAKYFIQQLLNTFAPGSRVGVAIFPGESASSPVLGKRWYPTDLLDPNFPLSGNHSGAHGSIGEEVGGIDCDTCTPPPGTPGSPTGIGVNWNGTPTREGLNVAKDMLTNALGSSSSTNSRVIVLLSDGAWNKSGDPANSVYLDGFESEGIHIYTVGMGSGIDNVKHSSLRNISINTGVGTATNPVGFTFFNLNEGEDVNLTTHFDKIMADMVSLEFLVDPYGTIRPGETKFHNALVTGHDSLASFTLSWESSQTNLLDFFVITPNGEKLKPQVSDNGYKNITVNSAFLKDPNNIGDWELVISSPSIREDVIPSITQAEEILYNYSVIVRSTLNMRIVSNKDKYFTGDKMVIEARLTESNQPLKGAAVKAKVRRPETGFGNWHLLNQVSANLIHNAPSVISGEPFTLLDRKNYVLLQQQKVRLPEIITEPTIVLNDDGIDADKNSCDGIYTGRFNSFDVQGVYKFHVIATGVAANGQEFRREREVHEYVDVALDHENMVLATVFKETTLMPFFPPTLVKLLKDPAPEGFVRKSAIFTPQDYEGNLWGPGWANKIKFIKVGEDTKLLDPLVDNLDGSYIQVIEYREGDVPNVKISARGITTPPIKVKEKLDYVFWIIIAVIIIVIIVILLLKKVIKQGQS